jgi:hypothetical protein
LIAEPVVADARRHRAGNVLRQNGARQIDSHSECRIFAPRPGVREVG